MSLRGGAVMKYVFDCFILSCLIIVLFAHTSPDEFIELANTLKEAVR